MVLSSTFYLKLDRHSNLKFKGVGKTSPYYILNEGQQDLEMQQLETHSILTAKGPRHQQENKELGLKCELSVMRT